jgi:hypothetical protein
VFNIKINNNSTTNEQQFNNFEELFDYQHQLLEQGRLLQREEKEQQSLNKSQIKKIENENVSYTDHLRDVFPKYYNKSFKLLEKVIAKTLCILTTQQMIE